jgi:hypothetical protein
MAKVSRAINRHSPCSAMGDRMKEGHMQDRTVPKDIQATLSARIDSIVLRLPSAPIREIAGELEWMRGVARTHHIGPALTVIHALDAALARGERGMLVQGWLTVLRDAIGCERQDRHAEQIFAAACSVRLAG